LSVPDYQTVMLPILEVIADGNEHQIRDVARMVADRLYPLHEHMRRIFPSPGLLAGLALHAPVPGPLPLAPSI